jgi:hypothetical protein
MWIIFALTISILLSFLSFYSRFFSMQSARKEIAVKASWEIAIRYGRVTVR